MRNDEMQNIRVAVVHEEPLIEMGVGAALRDQRDIVLVSPAQQHDVLVSDYTYALSKPVTTAGRADHAGRRFERILVLTRFERESEVRAALDMGIRGYMLQNCPATELILAVRALHTGRRYFCAPVTDCLANSLLRTPLTTREQQVLDLLALGLCNKKIAQQLAIAVGTVKVHIKAILEKLDARTRTHAVVLAGQRGLTNPQTSHTDVGRPTAQLGRRVAASQFAAAAL